VGEERIAATIMGTFLGFGLINGHVDEGKFVGRLLLFQAFFWT